MVMPQMPRTPRLQTPGGSPYNTVGKPWWMQEQQQGGSNLLQQAQQSIAPTQPAQAGPTGQAPVSYYRQQLAPQPGSAGWLSSAGIGQDPVATSYMSTGPSRKAAKQGGGNPVADAGDAAAAAAAAKGAGGSGLTVTDPAAKAAADARRKAEATAAGAIEVTPATQAAQAAVGASDPQLADLATKTAGKTGAGYKALVGKFDPWADWGKYGPAQNGQAKHANGTRMETDVERVYRWTNDYLRSKGYAGGENTPPHIRTQVFLANVERLKQEYGDRKMDWNASDFAGMDRQMTADGTPPGTDPTPRPGVTDPATGQPVTPNTSGPAGTTAGSPLPAAIAYAAGDPDAGYDLYKLASFGHTREDTGPFGEFMDRWLGPTISALINAKSGGNAANIPTNIDGMLAEVQSLLKGGQVGDQNLYDYMGSQGQAALRNVASGPMGDSDEELKTAMRAYNPLVTMGYNPLNRSSYYRQQGDLIQDMTARRLTDPTGNLGSGWTDWGQFFQNSDFYNRYYR